MKIKTLQNMRSCITDGQRVIPAGTVMEKFATCCSWTYFKGAGFTLILMNWAQWQNVEQIN